MKTIVRECFQRNVNTLKKKKRYITDDIKFSSDDSDESGEE